MSDRDDYRDLAKALAVPRERVELVEAQLRANPDAEQAFLDLTRAARRALDVILTAMRGMSGQWTHASPTEPGFYWRRTDVESEDEAVVEVLHADTGEMIFWDAAERRWADAEEPVGEWSGPLQPPD